MKKILNIFASLLFLVVSAVASASSFNTALTRATDINDGYMASTDFYTHEWAYDKIGIDPTVAWPIFSRTSAATNPETGASVATGVARYVAGFDGTNPGAILVEGGTTNLLTANQATGGDALGNTTGFNINAAGTTITYDTSEHWQGAGSIKVVCDGTSANQGTYLSYATVSASQNYTDSVFIKGSGTVRIGLAEYTSGNVIIGTITWSSPLTLTGQWQNISVSRLFGSTGMRAYVYILPTSQVATTFYVDGVQLEQKAYPTSWQNPADGARVDEVITAPATGVLTQAGPWTGACRYKANTPNASGSGSGAYLFEWRADVNNRFAFYENLGTLHFTVISGGVAYSTTASASIVAGTYYHAVVVNDGSKIYLYFLGTATGAGVPFVAPVGSMAANFYIGSRGDGLYQANGSIDDFQIWNRALSSDEIAALAARTTEAPVDAYTTYKLRFNNSLEPGKGARLVENWRLSGTDLIDASQLSGTIPSAVLGTSSFYLGTTSIALNRGSGALALTGITSIDGSAAKWTTARTLAGNSVDGSGNVAFSNKFIVQGTTDSGLSGAQFLGSLTTGILKNTTSTGVLSIASAGTDYAAPNQTMYIGTTAVAINRASATLDLTGLGTISANNIGIGVSASLPLTVQTTGTGTTYNSNTSAFFTSGSSGKEENIKIGDSVHQSMILSYVDGAGTPRLGIGGATEVMSVLSTGYVLMGSTTNHSSEKLQVTGTAYVSSTLTAGGFSGPLTGDVTGTASKASNMVGGNSTTLLGSMGYQSNTDTTTMLAPNTTSTKKFLRMTGTGTNGAAPVWDTIVAGDVPTLNQNTTGSAATLTTPRAIYGNNFDGSAALTQVIASTYGGTGNGFTKFSGPATAEKTFTLPNASATLLYDGGALGTPSSGTLTNCTFPTLNQNTTGSAASLSISGQTGLLTFTGLTSTNRIKTVRDAADTLLELGGSYTPTGTWNWTSATATWPTFNQNTTGSAAKLTTARAINGTNFDGSADITVAANNANDITTNATVYPLWTATQGGNYAAKTSNNFTYNPSTGLLSATAASFGSNGLNAMLISNVGAVTVQNTLQVNNTLTLEGQGGRAIDLANTGTGAAWAANGTVATAMTSLGPTGSHTTVQAWMVVTYQGTIGFIPIF